MAPTRMVICWLAAVLLLGLSLRLATAAGPTPSGSQLARGWGDHFNWQPLEIAKRDAADDNTATMVVIWKSWCGACKSLKPRFAESEEIKKAVQESGIKLVNLSDDEEPSEDMYQVDGGYIPRVVFLDSTGKKRLPVESGNAKYRLYYSDPGSIASAIRKAASLVGSAKAAEL